MVLLSTVCSPAGAAEDDLLALLRQQPELSSALVERVDDWFLHRGGQDEPQPLLEELSRLPGDSARYAWVVAVTHRGEVQRGHQALAWLGQLLEKSRRLRGRAARRLTASLQLARGRAHLWLGHNTRALADLQDAVDGMRRVDYRRGLVRALALLADGLINHSRRPREALPVLNELLVEARAAGMADQADLATVFFEQWQRQVMEAEDYFGRARHLLQQFPSRLGIPPDADLVAFADDTIIMNGDTDDQLQVAPPWFVSFDGLFTRRLKLPHPTLELRGSLLDRQRRLWAATNCGLYRYDDNVFIHLFNPELGPERENGIAGILAREQGRLKQVRLQLASNIVNEIKQGPDGLFYAATAGGLTIFTDSGEVREQLGPGQAPLPRELERVAPASDGSLAVAWSGGYAVRDPGGHWHRYDFTFPEASGRPDAKLFGLLADGSGSIWVHGLGGAFELRSGKIRRIVDRRFAAVTRNVNHVLRTADGTLWFASTDGLCRQSGRHCDTLSAQRWLPAEWTLDLLAGPHGSIWFSAYQGGLYRLLPPSSSRLVVADGLRQPVNYDLCRLAGHIYTTHGEGLSRFEPAGNKVDNFISGAEGIPPGELNHCRETGDGLLALWGPGVHSGKAVVLFDGQRGRLVGSEQGMPNQPIVALCTRQPRRLLLATRDHLLYLDTGEQRLRPARELAGLAGRHVTQLACRPAGEAWALTLDGRLARLSGEGFSWDDSARTLLGEPPRQLLLARGGEFLLFSDRRALRRRQDGWQVVPIGCPDFDFAVRQGAVDARGRLYLSSQSGVFVLQDDLCTRLGEADGLTSNTAFGLLPDGEDIWVAGGKGVAHFRWPHSRPPETFIVFADRVYFSDARRHRHRWQRYRAGDHPEQIKLTGLAGTFLAPRRETGSFLAGRPQVAATAPQEPAQCSPSTATRWHQDTLEVEFSGAVPFRGDTPGQLTYHYRLDDAPWQKTNDRRLRLEGLPDGRHRLEVRASDGRLNVDPTPALLCLVVDTPLPAWLPWLAGLLLALVGVAGRRRLYRLAQRIRLRKFHPIDPMPFFPGRPAPAELLLGRDEHLEKIREMTCASGGAVVVWGPDGSGKRSLLRQLRTSIASEGCLVAQVDLALLAVSGRIGNALRVLAQQLAEGNPQRASGEPGQRPGTEEDDDDPYRRLDLELQRLGAQQQPPRVALLLSSAELLSLSAAAENETLRDLFSYLRALLERHDFLTMVLSLRGRWFDLATRFQPLFSFATPVTMNRLTDEQVSQLFDRALAGRVAWTGGTRRLLVDYVGGHPAVAHLLGERLVSELNRQGTNICTGRLLKQVAATLVEQEQGSLSEVWQERTRQERLALAALASGSAAAPGVSEKQLLEALAESGIRLLPEELRRTLLALERDGALVRREDLLAIRGELQRTWIAQHHPVAQVIEEGHEYVGHYQLQERLGAGGMGVVFRARDLASGRLVALKLMRPELGESERSRKRFLREAQVGRRVDHPALVRILDYGEQGGRLYLAMEYCQGQTLERWRRQQTSLAASTIISMGRDLAAALEALHGAGILHRDIKSENVMVLEGDVTRGGVPRVKLMDFGLAAVAEESRVTRAGTLLGTVAFMSPEQARGDRLDERADLYSLGVVLYELCCGQTPFHGDDTAVLHDIIYRAAPALAERAPWVPPGLAALVDGMIAKSPDQRPASAAVVTNRLEQLLGEDDVEHQLVPAADARPASRGSRVLSRTIEAVGAESRLVAALAETRRSEQETSSSILLLQVAAHVARGPLEIHIDDALQTVQATLMADSLMLWLARDGHLQMVHHCGETAPRFDTADEWLREQLNHCRRERTALIIMNDTDDRDSGTLLACPLLSGNGDQRVLVATRSGPRFAPFGERERELAVACAHLLGMGFERDRLNRQLLEKERLAVAGEMLAGVAHDLRGPITVISGYVELVGEGTLGTDRQQYLDIIGRQVEQMNQMIANLMTFVRGEQATVYQEVSLGELLDDLRQKVEPLCQPRGIELRLQGDGQTISTDASKLLRIGYNLGKNAAEALGRNGTVTIRLQASKEGLRLEVEDNGPGIPPEEQQHLFEPFFTRRKRGGTGIGLFVVKRLVEEMGGSIEIDSQPQRGSCFRVHLPPA